MSGRRKAGCLIRLICFLVLLGLALILLFMFFLPYIVQYGITTRTGFPTRVAEMKSNPLKGTFRVASFEIDNPEHFPEPDFLEISRMEAEIAPGSIFRSRIVVRRLEIEVPSLTGIRNEAGAVNLDEFRNAVESMLDGRRSEEKGKEVVIERLRLTIDKVFLYDYFREDRARVEEYAVGVDLELSDITSLRRVAPEVLRRFASAGVSFEPESVFSHLVPESQRSRVRTEILGGGNAPEAGEETSESR